MITAKVNTLTGTTSAGSIVVTGEGGSTTTNLQQGLGKVWVHYTTESTTAIRDSFNLTGLTDAGTGKTTVTIANDMSNNDYSATMYTNCNTGSEGAGEFANNYHGGLNTRTTGSLLHESYATSGFADGNLCDIQILGDLA